MPTKQSPNLTPYPVTDSERALIDQLRLNQKAAVTEPYLELLTDASRKADYTAIILRYLVTQTEILVPE